MDNRARLYSAMLATHLESYRQMAFIAGPRQVGKTTTCRAQGNTYLDWDNEDHREIILRGPGAVAEYAHLDSVAERPQVIVFDELHKYRRWKLFLKGFFDTYEDRARVMVTGSSRLDVYRRGGDSLMGRYFLYRMHPFSVGELACPIIPEFPLRLPVLIQEEDWRALWEYGGYPEPFIQRNARFSRRWRDLRRAQLLKEDVRDLTRIQDLDQLATLGKILAERSGEQLVYSTLARTVRVSENTVRSWMAVLGALHYGFMVRPWYKNVAKALRKEPKWFLRDWSGVDEPGQRAETFCACHLLKAVEGWTDLGLGRFDLRYIRDKQKREADFLVTRDGKPWFLVEVKYRDTKLSSTLAYFQQQTECAHAFQMVIEGDFVEKDCFSYHKPVVVSARALLSQLL